MAMIARARELSKAPNTFWTDQFNNADNRNAYHEMAAEIIRAMGPDITEFITGVGTGGSFSGNAEIMKREVPGIRCIAIEPLQLRALSGNGGSWQTQAGRHRAGLCIVDLQARILPMRSSPCRTKMRMKLPANSPGTKASAQASQEAPMFGLPCKGRGYWALEKRS